MERFDPVLPSEDSQPVELDATLDRLAAYLRAIDAGVEQLLPSACSDAGARDSVAAAAAILSLFDRMVPQLHRIEEAHLFAAVIESMAGSDAVCLRDLTDTLRNEHRLLQHRWQGLRPTLQRRCAGDRDAAFDAAALADFAVAWRSHLARKQRELLPMAGRLLDDAALADIGLALDELRDAGWRPSPGAIVERATPHT